jgi:hypothetical protein
MTYVMNTALRSPQQQRVVGDALALVSRVRLWPFARVEAQGACTTIHSGAGDACIARLDLTTGALAVFVAADLARLLARSEPRARATRDGVRLDVRDADSGAAGERMLRRRIDLVRFGPQLAEASP